MLRGVGGLGPKRFHHTRIAGLLPGWKEAVVALSAEIHGSVGSPHVITGWRRLVHGDDVVIARAAMLLLTPPDGLVEEIVAPEQGGFRQAAVMAAPSRFEDGGAMVQPVHAKSAAVCGTVVVGSDVATIITDGGAAHNSVAMVADQRLQRRRQTRQRSTVSIKRRPQLRLDLDLVRRTERTRQPRQCGRRDDDLRPLP